MKIALTPEGAPIEASPDAPDQAICPHCGGVVLLRGRKVMGGNQKSYYWRHTNNSDPDCPGRSNIVKALKTSPDAL